MIFSDRAHPDPFLRSMCHWILKDYSESLSTLLQNNVGHLHPAYEDDDPLFKSDSAHTTNPNVFNFYVYLRTRPLLIRQYIASTAQEKRKTQVVLAGFSYGSDQNARDNKQKTDKQLLLEDTITPLERQLYFTTAHGHFKAGCPALALEVLNKLPSKVVEHELNSQSDEVVKGTNDHHAQINTGIIDWGTTSSNNDNTNTKNEPKTVETVDWGAPVSNLSTDTEFKIVWDEDDNEDKEDDEDAKSDKMDAKTLETKTDDAKTDAKSQDSNNQLDIMAQQLKFIACLKILMEELSTLATGYEVDGGQLRYQLYVWLEKEVEALKQLCNYSNTNVDHYVKDETSNLDNIQNEFDTPILSNKFGHDKPTLHEILLQEKQDFEAKVQRAARRKRWLKANETLLRTLLSYCSLHGASGGGLASVRMELILLLQELQQEKTQQQLLSPLPFPTTLPLLSACVAGNKTVIADPIRALQVNNLNIFVKQIILMLDYKKTVLKRFIRILMYFTIAFKRSVSIDIQRS